MKTKFLIVATTLTILAAPAFASTPSRDAFSRAPNDQATEPMPNQDMGNGDAYVAPFGDHLRQNQMDDMRPLNGRSRNNLIPPRMDASGVPDPRI